MSSIKDYFESAQLAFAAYATLDPSMNGPDTRRYVQSLRDIPGDGMSLFQAQRFAAAYEIVDQQPNTTSGFSATVFKKGDEYIFAVRGTEGAPVTPAGFVDWATNLGDIGADGIAIAQTLDMYNYYLKLTARQGQSVYQYAYDQSTGALIINSSLAQQDGLLAGKTFTVTGHSLGGHLAIVLSRLAPTSVQAVYTYNAAAANQEIHGEAGNDRLVLAANLTRGYGGVGDDYLEGGVGGAATWEGRVDGRNDAGNISLPAGR